MIHLARHAQVGEHSHGIQPHDHARPHEHREAEPRAPIDEHGDGSIEHGGLAALAPAAVVPPIAAVAIAEIIAVDAPSSRDEGVLRERARSRAPPTRPPTG
ncbi:MAG: hypothetical protein M3Y87_16570 [Myxococcota bacterium]|nr:hypothetical protein [Myxococcota bacterium]